MTKKRNNPMEYVLKIMTLDVSKNCLTPALTAIYHHGVPLELFFSFILPERSTETSYSSGYSFFTNISPYPLNSKSSLLLKDFETAEEQNIYLHLLAVQGEYKNKEVLYHELSGSIDIETSIKSFLKLDHHKTLETIHQITTVYSVVSNMETFFSSSMTLMPLSSNNGNTILIKYAVNNTIHFIQSRINFNTEENKITLNCDSFKNEVTICSDIAILNSPYKFGEIMDMFEQDKKLHVIHKRKEDIELKTFLLENVKRKIKDVKSESQIDNESESQASFEYRDTGNRILPMNILSGTRGEKSVLFNNILFKTILSNTHSNMLDTLPGKIYDIVKAQNNVFYILIWNSETRRGGIAPFINRGLGMDEMEWLWFDCKDQPRSLAFNKDLDVFFISMQGKGLIFLLENYQGSMLRDISFLFMENDTELAAKGAILDLTMGNFILPPDENSKQSLSQSFLMVGQQSAITLFYFEKE